MSKRKILLQLDPDPQPSVFDAVVAIDAGADVLLRHHNVRPEQVRDLVYGAIFTRGVDELHATAIFIGGSDVSAGEALLAAVRKTFFGPMRVSVMLDSNGANTTAAAAVLAVARHVKLAETTALVLAATGPVGSRVVRLLAAEGAAVRVASRDAAKAQKVCDCVAARVSGARLTACETSSPAGLQSALKGAQVVIAAGSPGVQLLSADARRAATDLRVVVDLSAVPPLGLEGVAATDKAVNRDGAIGYGALGVGGMKMKIHKAAIQKLFDAADQVLDAEEIFHIGKDLA